MFSHIKMTAMARWFVATRGRAMALTNLGYPLGEVLLPLPAVLMLAAIGWRASWGVVAAVIVLVILPLLVWLLAQDRAPQGSAEATGAPGLGGRHWQRSEVLRHWLFWALVPLLLDAGFHRHGDVLSPGSRVRGEGLEPCGHGAGVPGLCRGDRDHGLHYRLGLRPFRARANAADHGGAHGAGHLADRPGGDTSGLDRGAWHHRRDARALREPHGAR